MSHNKILRKLFGPKRNEVRGEDKILYNEGLYDLYSSPDIFQMIKSRSMRCAEYLARVGDRRGVCSVLVVRPEGK
jgi:hypothetical protein